MEEEERELLAQCYQEWSKVDVSRWMMRGVNEVALHHSRVLIVFSDPPNGLTNYGLILSLVNEQPAHPAELAGKPPPEGTKVFIMELLKLWGLADIT